MSNAPVIHIHARVPEWSFPERLRKVRRDELRMNQDAFAALIGVKTSTYSAWETGRNTPDILEWSEKLEEATGVSKFWFRGDLDGTPPTGPGGEVTRLYPYTPPKRAAHLSSIMSRLPNMDLEEVA